MIQLFHQSCVRWTQSAAFIIAFSTLVHNTKTWMKMYALDQTESHPISPFLF